MCIRNKRHRKSQSFFAIVLSLVVPAALIAPSAVAQEKPEDITIGIQLVTATDISSKQRGWAEDMLGIPVEWVTFSSGKDAVLGLAVGADMSLTGSAPAAFGLSSGVNGEVVWIYHLLGANETLVVQPDSGIESIEELKGKTVAVPFGTTTHFDLLKALEQAGMSQQDVKILDMSPQTMAAAFERGDIDAGWVWYPALARLYDAGGVAIMNALDMANAGYPTADLLTVNADFAHKYPDTIARFIATVHCGVVMGRKNIAFLVKDIMAEFGLKEDAAKQALTTEKRMTAEEELSKKWMGTPGNPGGMASSIWQQATFMAEQGLIPKAYDLEYYQKRVNPEYLQMAVDKGYTKQCDQLPNWPAS